MSPADEAAVSAPADLAEERRESAKRGWLIPAIIGTALFMQNLNSTVIATALPAMAKALHEDPLRLNLTITIYMLASACFLPISGWAADKYGAKKIFVASFVLFAASSVVCGFAQDLNHLVIARFFQGMAAAMMTPVGRLVLLRTTPKTELIGAMSVLTMPALLGPVIGPVLGGFIVTFWDWRWIFYINAPLAAAGLALVVRYVPNVPPQETTRFDLIGLTLTGVGLACLIFFFEQLGHKHANPGLIAGLFVAGAGLLTIYWAYARRNPDAILDLSLFRITTINASVVGGAFMRIGAGATPFLLAMLLQVVFGMSPIRAGFLTFMSAAGALIMKTTAPPILRRYGFRTTLIANQVIVGLCFMATGLLTAETPHWAVAVFLLVTGFFRSLQFTSLNGMAFADIDSARMSRASTMTSMGQQLIQSVGVGIAAALINLMMRLTGDTALSQQTVAPVFFIVGAISFVSILYFLPLAKDAGDEMNGRTPRRV